MLNFENEQVIKLALENILDTIHHLWTVYLDAIDRIKIISNEYNNLFELANFVLAQIYFYKDDIRMGVDHVINSG